MRSGIGRASASITSILLAACGGRTLGDGFDVYGADTSANPGSTLTSDTSSQDTTTNGTHASQQSCHTSFGCPAGERCDDGACVLDSDCPKPAAVQQFPKLTPPLYYTTGISVYDSREHLVALNASFETVLYRFPDGPALTVPSPQGCKPLTLLVPEGPFPVWCRNQDGWLGFRTLITGGDSQLIPQNPQAFPFESGADFAAFGFPTSDLQLVTTPSEVYELDPVSGARPAQLQLEGRKYRVSTRKNGEWGPGVVATTATATATTYWSAELKTGAEWVELGTVPGTTLDHLRPVGGAWYVIKEDDIEQTLGHVWRLRDGVAVDVGQAELSPLLALSGNPDLPAPNGHAVVHCEERTRCMLSRVGLDPPSSEVYMSVDIPTDDLLGTVFQRRLACSSVEAFIVTLHQQAGQWPTLAYFLVRMVPQ